MRVHVWTVLLVAVFFVSGCGEGPGAGLLSYTKVIKTEEINTDLAQAMPISRRSTFGSFRINRADIQPAQSGDRVVLNTNFSLTTFEIPEGINGSLAASSGLRYDPKSRQIFLTDLKPGSLQFGNASLAEYVSKGAQKGIHSIIQKVFSDIPIYELDSKFVAKFIKKITAYKGNIVIVYGL